MTSPSATRGYGSCVSGNAHDPEFPLLIKASPGILDFFVDTAAFGSAAIRVPSPGLRAGKSAQETA